MPTLSFKNQGLKVDWIGFNHQGLISEKNIKRIARYLFRNFEFNSTFAIGRSDEQQILFNDSKNKYKVHFRIWRYVDIYWDGVKIDFPGKTGNQFYTLIAEDKVNWKILRHFNLTRLDLCYSKRKTNSSPNLGSFLEKCYQKVSANKAIKHFSLRHDSTSSILKIGKRGSPNHYRVYEKQTEIRFELEQRGPKIKALQELILKNQIEELEQITIERFFKYTKKVLLVDEEYTDWIIDYIRKQSLNKHPIVMGYFNQNDGDEKKKAFRFLQFIAFSRTQKPQTKTFWGQPYSIFQFEINDFMQFTQTEKNQYQRDLLIQFFQQLQTLKPFVQIFLDGSFQSSVIFPIVKVRKQFGNYGPWLAEIAILQELYYYSYPFSFPIDFFVYKKDFELQIKFKFIQSFTNKSLTKTFQSGKIFRHYKNANNQKKAQIKQFILSFLQQLLKYKYIQASCKVQFKNKNKKKIFKLVLIQQLTPLLIGQTENIYLFEQLP